MEKLSCQQQERGFRINFWERQQPQEMTERSNQSDVRMAEKRGETEWKSGQMDKQYPGLTSRGRPEHI